MGWNIFLNVWLVLYNKFYKIKTENILFIQDFEENVEITKKNYTFIYIKKEFENYPQENFIEWQKYLY